MKKLESLLCSLTLALTLFSVPVFAAEVPTEVNSEDFSLTSNDITTRATSKGLHYLENKQLTYSGDYTFTVKPEKGANLRIWTKIQDGDMRIKVKKGLTTVYNNSFSSGERDVLITSNCSGGNYTVTLSTTTWSIFSLLAYQN